MDAAVNKVLECPICLEILKEPKTLNCNHSFCKSCLADILKSKYLKKDQTLNTPGILSIVCPTCKGNSQEFRSLDDIGTLHIINELLEAHTKERSVEKEDRFDCSCGNVAKFFCSRCNSRYCSRCCNDQIKEHCPVQDEGLSSFMQCTMRHFFVKIQPQQDIYMCKDHSVALDFFCNYCREAICINCFLIDHRDHETKAIKCARKDAIQLVDRIQSIDMDNAFKFDQLHQEALDVSDSAVADKKAISDQLEAEERKIHGLISILFKKARLYYSNFIELNSTIAEDTLKFCEEVMSKGSVYDFASICDFELACLVKDLIAARDKREYEMKSLEQRRMKLDRAKFQKDLKICINAKAIFNAMLRIFDHIQIGSKMRAKFIPHSFKFEDYSNGKYSDSKKKEEISNMDINSSVRPTGRISYSRDFLLSLSQYKVKPTLPEGLESIARPLIPIRPKQRELRKVHSDIALHVQDEYEDDEFATIYPHPYRLMQYFRDDRTYSRR